MYIKEGSDSDTMTYYQTQQLPSDLPSNRFCFPAQHFTHIYNQH